MAEPMHRLYHDMLRAMVHTSALLSLILPHSCGGPVPQAEPRESPVTQLNDNSNNDDEKEEEFWKSVNIKVFLCVLVFLLVIIIVLIIVIACWKCWKRSRLSVHEHRHHPPLGYTCTRCMGGAHFSGDVRRGEGHGCSVETSCQPAYCHWTPHCQQLHQLHVSANPRDTIHTPPPAYPIRTQQSLTDVSQSSERVGPTAEVTTRPTESGQRTDVQRHVTSPSWPNTDAMFSLRSRMPSDVTTGNDDREQTVPMTSLLCSGTSPHSLPTVMYTPSTDSVVLRTSQTSSTTTQPEVSQAEPMNIECPGLFQTFPPALRDLYVPAQRSETRTVAGKLVVSVARLVDSKGDYLVLDNMGICLQIPPGAIQEGQRQLVTLVLNWDLGDNPEMDNRQALVSPVVYCGPHGLQLHKPCVLSFKHCAFDTRMVQVMSSQTELVEPKDWQVLCSAERDADHVAMTTDECQVRLQHFSLFTCVQTPPLGQSGKKWLLIAAFCAPLQRQVHHYQVRVYFLNKTPCALQWAIQNEARFGFRLACPERTVLFHGSGEDMHLEVEYVSRGWVAIKDNHLAENVEESGSVSYHAIWHGKCPHLSFCFKRTCLLPQAPPLPASCPSGVTTDTSFPARVQPHVSEINLNLSLFQETSANSPDRMNLLLTEVPAGQQSSSPSSSSCPPSCSPTHLLPTCDKHPINISMPPVPVASGKVRGKVSIDPHTPGPSVMVDFVPDPECIPDWVMEGLDVGQAGGEVYPQELKVKLKVKLDPPSPFGHDWRLLASKMGLDGYIRWLSFQDSPTLHVLQYMETQKKDLHCLCHLLKAIQRHDAAADVENVISQRHRMTSDQQEGQEHSFFPEMDSLPEKCLKENVISQQHRMTSDQQEGQEHSFSPEMDSLSESFLKEDDVDACPDTLDVICGRERATCRRDEPHEHSE